MEAYPCGEGGNNLVTLTCDVTLTDEVSDFYAVLPVGVLYHGVIVEIYDGETLVGQIPFPESHAAQVVRNTIKSFQPVEVLTHEYVDLGLPSGLLWATCNVGAETPEEYGDYFSWGETTPKGYYSWDNYQYGDGSTITKYTGSDGLTTLLPEDDAATANWGNDWRMPTKEEFQELYNNTTVTWTQQNGVNGRLFTADNGNSLFLPAGGIRREDSLNLAGYVGDYWSSSLSVDYSNAAYRFYFGSGSYNVGNNYRYTGFTVRSVREN